MTVSPICPTCGKPLDPTHAPIARIRGGKVVSFCSAECAATGMLPAPRRTNPQVPIGEADTEVAPRTPSGRDLAAETRRAGRMRSSREYLQVAPVDTEAPTPLPRRGSRKAAILLCCALVLAAGVALLVIQFLPMTGPPPPAAQADSTGAAARPTPVSAAATPRPTPPTPPPDNRARRDAAAAVLRTLTDSTSPRVRRLAAQALARTADEKSLDVLRQLLREEPSQLGRIQIAYALARAGDGPARESLRLLLGAEKRDIRLDAARSLVQLGDDSGRKTLRSMLSVEQHRVGAAGLLARLGDEEGLKVLRAEVASERTTPEARMRAQVALGRAGDASVAPALHQILTDRRYNVGAADALAALGDREAAPALTVQLGLSAMRVQAALWLRRIKVDVDLAPLDLALRAADEASRVTAAEALLILAGPPELAERD